MLQNKSFLHLNTQIELDEVPVAMMEEREVFLDEQVDRGYVLKPVHEQLFVSVSELHSPGMEHLHCWSCAGVFNISLLHKFQLFFIISVG